MAEQNNQNNQGSTKTEYNPYARITRRGFENIIAGGNKEAPLVEWDAFGKPTFNYHNVGKATPATLTTTVRGEITTQEDLVNRYSNLEKYQDDVRKIYAAIEPEFSKSRNIGSVPVTLWDAANDAYDRAGNAFGRVFLNSAHAVIAQKHNFLETRWKSFINKYDNDNQDKINAEYALYKLYGQANEDAVSLVKADKLLGADGKPLSTEAKKIVNRYRDLVRERRQNDWRMTAEQIYEGERAEWIERWQTSKAEGNRSTMYGFLANLSGDIAGSLAAYYVVGRVAGGSTATLGSVAAKMGMRFAPAIMSSASVVGTRAIIAPSFLSQYNAVRTQALMRGADLDTANAAGFYAGVAEAGLEFAGFKCFNRLYSEGGWIRNYILSNVIPESLQEGSQTTAENVITKYFGVNDSTFTEIMKEIGLSIIAGGIGGGIFSSTRMNAEAIAASTTAVFNAYRDATKGIAAENVKAGAQDAISDEINDGTPPEAPGSTPAVVPSENIERLGSPQGQELIGLGSGYFEPLTMQREGLVPTKTTDEDPSYGYLAPIGATEEEDFFAKMQYMEQQPTTTTFAMPGESDLAAYHEEVKERAEKRRVEEAGSLAATLEAVKEKKTKEEEDARIKAAEEKEAARKAAQKTLKKMFAIYSKAVKKKNPNITRQQLQNGYKAILLQYQLQEETGLIEDKFYNLIDNMVTFIDKSNKAVQKNNKDIQKLLTKNGFTKEDALKLTSKDRIKKHEAQWKLAEAYIVETYESAGLSTASGKLAAKFLKGLLYETTFLMPSLNVETLVKSMGLKIINAQVAQLHGLFVPDHFSSMLSYVTHYGKSEQTPEAKRRFAENIASLLLAPKENAGEIYALLCKDSDLADLDPDCELMLNAIRYKAEAERKILDEMPISSPTDLSETDYMVMAIMRSKGATQGEISDVFDLQIGDSSKSQEAMYEEALNVVYPKPSEEDLKALSKLSDEIVKDEKTSRVAMKSRGAYINKRGGVIVVKDPLSTAPVHEFGHFSMTKVLFEGLKLKRLGLLPKQHAIWRIIDRFESLMKTQGRVLTNTEFQETLLDAFEMYIKTNQTIDPFLTGLFDEFKREHKSNIKMLQGSSLLRRTKESTGKLSEEKKEGLIKEIGTIVENSNPANMAVAAFDLESFSLFQQQEGVQEILGVEQSLNIIKGFVYQYPVADGDKMLALAEMAAEDGDLITLRGIIFDLAQMAKGQSFDAIVSNLSRNVKPREYSTLTKKEIAEMPEEKRKTYSMFRESDRKMDKSDKEKRETYSPLAADEVYWMVDAETKELKRLRLPIPLHKEIKNIDWKETVKAPLKAIKEFLESLDSAAKKVSPELSYIISKEFYNYAKMTQETREEIGKLTSRIENHNKTYRDNIDKRVNLFEIWPSLANGDDDSYTKAREYLVSRMGEDAGKEWDAIINRLFAVKQLLIKSGVDPDLFGVKNYFPLKVKEYEKLSKEYFGKAQTNSEIAKIINRAYKEALEAAGTEKLSPEQEKKLEIEIVNKINGTLMGKTDDFKVTAFLHRSVLKHDSVMLQYYHDMFDTLNDYFESAYRTIMMRKLVGFVTYDQNDNPIIAEGQGVVGQFLIAYQQSPAGKAHMEAVDNFKRKMSYLAERHGDDIAFFKAIREINQFTTLGSPINAINQIQDVAIAAANFGPINVMEAVGQILSGAGIKIADINAQTSNEAFRPQGQGVLSKTTKTVYKYTGFEKIDEFAKNTIINSASVWFKKALNSNEDSAEYKRAMYYIDQTFPPVNFMQKGLLTEEEFVDQIDKRTDTRSKVIAELKQGIDPNKMSDDIKFLLWSFLSKTQPINALTVPAMYNRIGSAGKLCYQFATVSIRQIEGIRDFYLSKAAAGGVKEAARGLAELLIFCTLVGLGKDIITNLMRGRKTDVLNSMLWSPAQIFMVNEYIASIAANEGLFSATVKVASPSFGILDNVTKDVVRFVKFKDYKGHTFKSVPVFGQFAYWWFFGGRDFNIKTKQALFDMTETMQIKENAEKTLGAL